MNLTTFVSHDMFNTTSTIFNGQIEGGSLILKDLTNDKTSIKPSIFKQINNGYIIYQYYT